MQDLILAVNSTWKDDDRHGFKSIIRTVDSTWLSDDGLCRLT